MSEKVSTPRGEDSHSHSARSEVGVSVIVSTRNRAHYLPEVLKSLGAQDCDLEYEVIVIDNGSTDRTPALLEEWCRRDGRFRTAREPQPGLSRGKNAGIRIARGSLLLFTDDDMRIHPRWLQSYVSFFAQHEGELIVAGGPIFSTPHDLGEWPPWLDRAALVDAGSLDYQEERPLKDFEYVWGGNMAIPRVVFEEVGVWDESAGLQADQRVTRLESEFFEDTELQDRVRRTGRSSWFCPSAVVYHRVDRASVTPRRIISTAFARGRNDFWQYALRVWHQVDLVPKRNALKAALALAENLCAWGLWLLLFRVSGRKRFFERARRAAFASGHSLERLRAGRNGMRIFHGAARLAFPTRRLLLRFTPDVA